MFCGTISVTCRTVGLSMFATFTALGRSRFRWASVADYPEKRRLLGIVFLNLRLDGVTLVSTVRKPFDVLAEGLLSTNSRDNKTPLELFLAGIASWDTGLRRRMDDGSHSHK